MTLRAPVRDGRLTGADPGLERFFGGRDRHTVVEHLLTEILAELQRQRADRERDRQPASNRDDDARFVAAIAASVAGRVFSIMELRAHARVDPDLQRAIGGLTNQQLGKRLRDLAGRVVGGFVVERVTRDESGVVWAVSAAPDLHAGAGIAVDSGA